MSLISLLQVIYEFGSRTVFGVYHDPVLLHMSYDRLRSAKTDLGLKLWQPYVKTLLSVMS